MHLGKSWGENFCSAANFIPPVLPFILAPLDKFQCLSCHSSPVKKLVLLKCTVASKIGRPSLLELYQILRINMRIIMAPLCKSKWSHERIRKSQDLNFRTCDTKFAKVPDSRILIPEELNLIQLYSLPLPYVLCPSIGSDGVRPDLLGLREITRHSL